MYGLAFGIERDQFSLQNLTSSDREVYNNKFPSTSKIFNSPFIMARNLLLLLALLTLTGNIPPLPVPFQAC